MTRTRYALAAAAVPLTAVILYYAVLSRGALPDHQLIHGWNDLFLHIVAFCGLAIVILAFGLRRDLMLAGLVSLAGAIEMIQIFIPDRTASLDDLAASLLGVGLGWLLVWAGRGAAPVLQAVIQTIRRSSSISDG